MVRSMGHGSKDHRAGFRSSMQSPAHCCGRRRSRFKMALRRHGMSIFGQQLTRLVASCFRAFDKLDSLAQKRSRHGGFRQLEWLDGQRAVQHQRSSFQQGRCRSGITHHASRFPESDMSSAGTRRVHCSAMFSFWTHLEFQSLERAELRSLRRRLLIAWVHTSRSMPLQIACMSSAQKMFRTLRPTA